MSQRCEHVHAHERTRSWHHARQSLVHCHFPGPHPAGPFQPGAMAHHHAALPSYSGPFISKAAGGSALASQAPARLPVLRDRARPLALMLARKRGPCVAERIEDSSTIFLSPLRIYTLYILVYYIFLYIIYIRRILLGAESYSLPLRGLTNACASNPMCPHLCICTSPPHPHPQPPAPHLVRALVKDSEGSRLGGAPAAAALGAGRGRRAGGGACCEGSITRESSTGRAPGSPRTGVNQESKSCVKIAID
jgi:hypothetical protein